MELLAKIRRDSIRHGVSDVRLKSQKSQTSESAGFTAHQLQEAIRAIVLRTV